jgi:hypothetical protein
LSATGSARSLGVRRSPRNRNDQFRTRAKHRLQILDEVAAHGLKSLELHEKAGRHRGDGRFMEFERASRLDSQIAAEFVRKFWDCVDPGRQRGDQINTRSGDERTPPPPGGDEVST